MEGIMKKDPLADRWRKNSKHKQRMDWCRWGKKCEPRASWKSSCLSSQICEGKKQRYLLGGEECQKNYEDTKPLENTAATIWGWQRGLYEYDLKKDFQLCLVATLWGKRSSFRWLMQSQGCPVRQVWQNKGVWKETATGKRKEIIAKMGWTKWEAFAFL